ncbi:Monocarboxylate transporter 14 [Cyphomyrmex costatus]|uniref:Monocarboxylate transporter 14 n=1 Tax=Cyphomyrmex costatus TaxID=456900 RepID=A0A195CUZ7_9HYME|nr:Monocarboxylate transporter 14 [Cyphomyrmex costatus]
MISRNDIILQGIEAECENGCEHDNNNDQNCSTSVANVRKEDAFVKRSHSNYYQPHRAPLVGWQNGSPTIYSNLLQQSVDFDETSLPSKSCNVREINLDAINMTDRSIDAIELLEPTDTIIKPMEQSDAWNKIQKTPVNRKDYADTRRNRMRVKDSIDSLSISEREESLSFIAREAKREKPKVPDGGWGWVVVLASLVISMVADGVSFSFGLLYIEFLHEFGASKSKTAWIGSLFMAVPLLSGPIMSALVDRYGCRNMTIAGGLISGLGFILSIFSNTIEVMYLTFGVIAGLGLGLCYVTAVVSIAFWFDKKRTLAVGLGACGTGIGTFVYAPMTTYFIEEYGWRGACLLLAGTFFNMIVAGTVMRDPEWWILEQRKQDQALPKKSYGRSDASSSDEFPGVEELRKLFRSDHAPEYFLQNLSTTTKAVDGVKRQTTSVVNLPTFVKQSEKVPLEVLELLLSNSRLYTVILENYPSLLCRSLSDKQLQDSTGEICNKSGVTMSMRLKRATESKAIIEQKKDSTSIHAPTKQVCGRKISRKEIEEINPVLAKEIMHAIICYYICEATRRATHRITIIFLPGRKWYAELIDLLKGMLDFSMFFELHFLLMSLSTMLLFTWFIIPYFYLAEHMTRNGYDESNAANLLSIIGITNTIGMIGLGWAGDQPWMNVRKTYAWCLIACGAATIFMSVFTQHYVFLSISSAAFGLFFASNFSFTPVILVELIPLERFTTAYGLSLLCQGIGNLLGPPLAGWFFDVTGSWELSFQMAGGWIIVSGILVGIIPYTRNRKIFGSGPIEMERMNCEDCLA